MKPCPKGASCLKEGCGLDHSWDPKNRWMITMIPNREPTIPQLNLHQTADGTLEAKADGWWEARCVCGFRSGPLPDRETTVDVLMDHTAESVVPKPKSPVLPRLSGESPCHFSWGNESWGACNVHGWTGQKQDRSRVWVCPSVNDR